MTITDKIPFGVLKEPRIWRQLPLNTIINRAPPPHTVHYINGHITYCRPDQYFALNPYTPSDSVWIVPGTLKS